MSPEQHLALEYACSPNGGWPRAIANERSWVIRSYRALQRRGLIVEVPADAKDGRLHFVATEAGHAALAEVTA